MNNIHTKRSVAVMTMIDSQIALGIQAILVETFAANVLTTTALLASLGLIGVDLSNVHDVESFRASMNVRFGILNGEIDFQILLDSCANEGVNYKISVS